LLGMLIPNLMVLSRS